MLVSVSFSFVYLILSFGYNGTMFTTKWGEIKCGILTIGLGYLDKEFSKTHNLIWS